MTGEVLVAVLLGVIMGVAILGSMDRATWRRVWDEIFADAWCVQATKNTYESVVGAILWLGVMVAGLAIQAAGSVRAWWREKVFVPPRVAIKTFADATGREGENTMVFISEVGILVWRLLLWLAIAAVASVFRQLLAERAETKRVFATFADSIEADDHFCATTLTNRQDAACEAVRSVK